MRIKQKKECSINVAAAQIECRKSKLQTLKRYVPFYIMFAPVLIYFLTFAYAPMVGLTMAFKDYNFKDGIFGSPWAGFEHFERFVFNGDFWRVMGNTLSISFLRIAFSFPAPIILALMLNEVHHPKYKKFVQTATYLPHFISWVIVYGILYNFFSLDGVVNQITSMFGAEPVMYMASKKYYRALYVGSAIWKEIGWSAIIYLAALSGVDAQLYEAGALDGVNRWQKIWHITIPSILSIISVQFILSFGQILNVGFEQVLVMYNATVSEVAETLDYYIYRVGLLQANNFSYATAVGMFRGVVSLVLVIITNYISNKIDEDGGIW